MSYLLARLKSAFASSVPPAPDLELLTRFIDRNDQDAFAELVRRYGSMVLGVCRRTLGDGPDAEDAYQAAFLVLAQRAGAVRRIGRVAGWLHSVATLTAKKARARRAKRRAREHTAGMLTEVPTELADTPSDLAAVLDEELAAIPEKYHAAVVLCELRGLSLDQAAAELGVPRGTVASRLARGREALGRRLLRRGLFSTVLPPLAPLGPPSVDPTPAAHSLTHEVLRAMILSHCRWLPVAVLPLFVVGFLCVSPVITPTVAAPIPKAGDDTDKLLARVRIDNIGSALSHPVVAKEIGLTDAQQKQVDELSGEMVAGFQAKVRAAKPQNNGGVEESLAAFGVIYDTGREFDEKVEKMLTPEQVRRLKQIQLQKEGPAALLGRHAIRSLNPSGEQEDKMTAELAKAKKQFMLDEMIAMASGAVDGQGVAETAAMNKLLAKHAAELDAVQEAMLKVLTKEQRATWAKMTGEPLPRLDLLKANTVFGDAKAVKMIADADKIVAPPPVAPAPAQPEPPEVKK